MEKEACKSRKEAIPVRINSANTLASGFRSLSAALCDGRSMESGSTGVGWGGECLLPAVLKPGDTQTWVKLLPCSTLLHTAALL